MTEGIRQQFLDGHLKKTGVSVSEGDENVTADLQAVWDEYGLIGTANWPIYVTARGSEKTELWGYVGLSFTGDRMRRMAGDEVVEELVNTPATQLGMARPAAERVESYFRLNPRSLLIDLPYD